MTFAGAGVARQGELMLSVQTVCRVDTWTTVPPVAIVPFVGAASVAILVARIRVLVSPTLQKSEPRVAGGGDVFLSKPRVDDGVPAFSPDRRG